MSAALDWLGGTEEDVCRESVVEMLCGLWQDNRGSIYALSRGRQFALDVLTTRPCGAQRFTSGLVQCHAGPFVALWGRSGQKYRGQMDGSQLTWRRADSEFLWRKIQ